jgi:hypothetical protein
MKAKHLVLLGPFGREVSEANNANAVRECAVQRSRLAIVSAVAVGSMTSSSSQRRPRGYRLGGLGGRNTGFGSVRVTALEVRSAPEVSLRLPGKVPRHGTSTRLMNF